MFLIVEHTPLSIAILNILMFYFDDFEKSFLENSSFIDESIDVPPLENLPDLSEFPSFLGKDFGDRQCGRITRSRSSRFNPIH